MRVGVAVTRTVPAKFKQGSWVQVLPTYVWLHFSFLPAVSLDAALFLPFLPLDLCFPPALLLFSLLVLSYKAANLQVALGWVGRSCSFRLLPAPHGSMHALTFRRGNRGHGGQEGPGSQATQTSPSATASSRRATPAFVTLRPDIDPHLLEAQRTLLPTTRHESASGRGGSARLLQPPAAFQSQGVIDEAQASTLAILYRDLGVESIGPAGLFQHFILPQFPQLEPPAKRTFTELLVQDWAAIKRDSDDPAFQAQLNDVALVPTAAGGEVAPPSALLDPSNELLASIFEDDPSLFPSPDWVRNPRRMAVLRDLGLRSTLDAQTFLDCARKLESRWRELAALRKDDRPSGDQERELHLVQLAHNLLRALHETTDPSQTTSSTPFLRELADIACVPANTPPDGRVSLLKFRDCALPRDRPSRVLFNARDRCRYHAPTRPHVHGARHRAPPRPTDPSWRTCGELRQTPTTQWPSCWTKGAGPVHRPCSRRCLPTWTRPGRA